MKGMRSVLSGVAALGLIQTACAADLDYLRGSDAFAPAPATYFRWSGFYFGGQAGYGNTRMDFSDATASLVAFMLRESGLENLGHVSQWKILGQKLSNDSNYGGFVGYNSQWEDVVLGIEANYTRASIFGSDSGSLGRIVAPGDGFTYDVTVAGTAAMRLTDYGTLRARAGYVIGSFLPYATVGLALGRVETSRSVTVAGTQQPSDGSLPASPFFFTKTENKTNYPIGFAAGAGIDIAVLSNLFVRGEFEWVQFTDLPGIHANIATGRLAAGLKF
jgi:outer membrane immunogenic protein